MLLFVASSTRDLAELPVRGKEELLTALTVVRLGETPPSAKPWKGEGPGVFELVEDFNKDTYRCVYTVRFAKAVYVLHVFQKKSKHGRKTPLPDVRLIGTRLERARQDYEARFPQDKR